MQTMMQLVDGALAEMLRQIDQPTTKKGIKTSVNIEHEINNYRTQLKNQNLHDVNAGLYDYQLGVFYVDFISECEKLGDYVMNVVQAGKKRNNDFEDLPYNEQGKSRERVNLMVSPPPGVVSAVVEPSWAATAFFTMARPRPVPPSLRERPLSMR